MILLATCLVLPMAACNRNKSFTSEENARVSESIREFGTRCVGRYLIDVPKNVMTFGSAKLQGVEFEATPMSEEEFFRGISAREAKLKSTINLLHGYRVLYEHDVVPGLRTSHYFVSLSNPEGQPSDMLRTIEAYRWDRGYQIKLQVEGTDSINSVYVQENRATPYGIPDQFRKNDIPEKTRLVIDLLNRVQGRDENIIPDEPGVCFLGGFLRGGAAGKESITSQFVLRHRTDVSFDLQTDSDIRESTTLLERGGSINNVLDHNDGRTIRKGPVTLPGMQAEEWLMAGTTTLDVPGHHLTLEANSKIGSPKTPLVTLDMDTGSVNSVQRDHIDKASMTEGEAVALWDAVSKTLRPRQNGF